MPGELDFGQPLTVEVFGVTVEVSADARQLAAVRDFLPPGAKASTSRPERGRFALLPADDQGLIAIVHDQQSLGAFDAGLALGILDGQIRMHIALHAPDHFFVHAGVVGIAERAIVLPGKSFAGKTTLVAALIAAGAEYWSDEYAALDADGQVHPYAKPLSVRTSARRHGDRTSVESLGGQAGDRPLQIGLIALTQYRPGGSWSPRVCSAGEGAIKLLEHTVSARSRPEQALDAVRRAAANATVLEGERGEAAETAAALLRALAG